MKKFVFLYTGRDESAGMRESWMAWFAENGASFVDSGNPLGPGVTVTKAGSHPEHSITGYSLVVAEDLAAAEALAKTSPAAAVQVYEALPM